jgi:hypothetical protein
MWGGNLLWGSSVSMHDLWSRQILLGRGSDVKIHMQRMQGGNLLCSHSSVCRIDMSR